MCDGTIQVLSPNVVPKKRRWEEFWENAGSSGGCDSGNLRGINRMKLLGGSFSGSQRVVVVVAAVSPCCDGCIYLIN
jgi:hypothetical protein